MTRWTVIASGDHIAQSAPPVWLPLPWCCLWAVAGVTHFPLCCDQLACQRRREEEEEDDDDDDDDDDEAKKERRKEIKRC